jgi:hypothetical protein
MNRPVKSGERLLCVPTGYRHASYDPTVGEVYTCINNPSLRMVDVTGPPPKSHPAMIRMRFRNICFISLPDEIDLRENK